MPPGEWGAACAVRWERRWGARRTRACRLFYTDLVLVLAVSVAVLGGSVVLASSQRWPYGLVGLWVGGASVHAVRVVVPARRRRRAGAARVVAGEH